MEKVWKDVVQICSIAPKNLDWQQAEAVLARDARDCNDLSGESNSSLNERKRYENSRK